MTKAQIIYEGKRPTFAVVPYAQWVALTRRVEAALTDEELFDVARAEDGGEQFPHEVVKRLVDGESPVKVFRQYRNMTQDALAAAARVSTGYVSQIERGKRQPSQKILAVFATVLELDVEDLS